MPRIVDIVVPVRRDAEAARRCLASVLASRNDTAFAIVAVVDRSIERELAAAAADVLRDSRAAVSVPDRPLDYAASVDRALALHVDRDAVLLQADAEVHGDWLDRLVYHGDTAHTGIVGTFSNVAGIATYPRVGEPSAIPGDTSATALDALFAASNVRRSAEVAGVFGPCLFLKRACVSAAGGLRFVTAADGHDAEIDFSVRAADLGFRARVAGDVFVANGGEGSFGGRGAAWCDREAADTLAHLHPAHAQALRARAVPESLRYLARRVDLARLAASPRPAIAFVSHGWGGGVRRYMDDLARLAQGRADVLYVEPAGGNAIRLHWPHAGEGFEAWFRLPDELPALARTLRGVGVARLHFQHVHGLPQSILRLPQEAGLPYDCTLHDYVAICPQYHLVDEHGRYCGEPDAAGCAACLAKRPGQWDLPIAAWRTLFGEFLRSAARVIAPSQDAAARVERYFPGLSISVWPHPEAALPAPRPVVRVVTLGNLTPEKGLHVVAACAEDARRRSLALAFRVLGSTSAPIAQSAGASLTIHGSYAEAQLPELLAGEHADVLFFPAQVPETYSYTLSVALATDTPIVASAIGAFPERLAGHANAQLLPFDADAAQWNAALTAAGEGRASTRHDPALHAAS